MSQSLINSEYKNYVDEEISMIVPQLKSTYFNSISI